MTEEIGRGRKKKKNKAVIFSHCFLPHLIHFTGLQILFTLSIHRICWHQKHKTKTTKLLPRYAKKGINWKNNNTIMSKIFINPHLLYLMCTFVRSFWAGSDQPPWLCLPWMCSRVQTVTNIPRRNFLLSQRYSRLTLNMYLPTCLGATEAETAPAYMKKYAAMHMWIYYMMQKSMMQQPSTESTTVIWKNTREKHPHASSGCFCFIRKD